MAIIDSVANDKEDQDSDTSEKTTPELTTDELLIRIKSWWNEDYPLCNKFHTEARRHFRFRAGDQYDEADKSYLNDPANKRIALVFNRIDPVIDAVVGAEITNRQEVRFLPRQVADGPANEVLTEAARWFRDDCDAEHEESNSFADAATCGMGWTETRLDYEENPDGKPLIKRRDPTEMYWDASSREANLTDARRIYRVRGNVPLVDAKAMFPTYPDGGLIEEDENYDATWAAKSTDDEKPYIINRPQGYSPHEAEEGTEGETVTLVQVQWVERQPFYRAMALDPMTGRSQTRDLTEDEHFNAQQRATELNVPYRAIKQTRKCYYEAFLGKEVLKISKLIAPSGKHQTEFNFNCITGKLDNEEGYFYGLVRGMEGPQKFANKWLSTAVEIMARNAKGGLMMEAGAVEDVEEFEANWAKPGSNAYFKSGAMSSGRVQPKPDAKFPSDFMEMTQFAITSIRDTTGVNAEILGMADANQPASLEYQRRQSATIILAPLFDSLRRYRRIEGRVLLFLITEYLSDGRLIRIVGKESERYVPLIRDPNVTEYDVIVDDAPSSPSQKELVWNSLNQMAPLLAGMQLPPDVYLALLDYSPFPSSVAAKIKMAVTNAQQNAPPPPPDPVQVYAQQKQIDIQAEQQKNNFKTQEHQAKLQSEIQTAQLGAESDQMKTNQQLMFKKSDHDLDYAHKFRLAQMEEEFKQREAAMKAGEEIRKAREVSKSQVEPLVNSIKAAHADHLSPMIDAFKTTMNTQNSMMEGVKGFLADHAETLRAMREDINKPRKRTLVKDKNGRATHSIEEIIK